MPDATANRQRGAAARTANRCHDPLVPSAYKPVEARSVGRALVTLARNHAPGVRVVESREVRVSYAA